MLVRAEAGVEWDDFVAWAVGCGYGGVENLSLIPGYVGAAPVQNIGAYGAEVKDVIREVELYRPDLDRWRCLPGEACAFGYRDSVFKRELRGRAIILSVTFALDLNPVFRLGYGDLNAKVAEAGGPTLRACAMRWVGIRRSKLPDPAGTGQRRQLFQKSRGAARVCAASARTLSRHAFLRRGCGACEARSGLADRPCGLERKTRGMCRDAPAAGTGPGQLRRGVRQRGARSGRRVQQEVRERFGVDIEMEVNVL